MFRITNQEEIYIVSNAHVASTPTLLRRRRAARSGVDDALLSDKTGRDLCGFDTNTVSVPTYVAQVLPHVMLILPQKTKVRLVTLETLNDPLLAVRSGK